jgi:hypothetical protein
MHTVNQLENRLHPYKSASVFCLIPSVNGGDQ